MRRWGLLLAVATAPLIALPTEGRSQEDCTSTGSDLVSGIYGTITVRGARLRCQDLIVRADSALLYQQSRQYQLFGRVTLDNRDIRLRARNAQYYPEQGMITAQGAIDLLRKQDSTSIRNGENLVLNRGGVLGRTEDILTVTGGRPHAVLRPKRAEGAPPDSAADLPYEVDANQIVVTGQERFEGTGNVEIHRGDLDATADQVLYLGSTGQLSLTGNARLDTDRYDLTGGVILVTMAGEEITEVIARQNAKLTGDIELTGGVITLALMGGELDLLTVTSGTGVGGGTAQPAVAIAPGAAAQPGVAVAPGAGRGAGPPGPTAPGGARPPGAPAPTAAPATRATATSEEFSMTGDRLEIDVTGDRIERVDAIGGARMVSFAGDSLNAPETPEIVRRDWMEGDTIFLVFAPPDSAGAPGDTVSVAPRDSASASDSAAARPKLERLEARGRARALYRLPPADTTNAADSTCAGPGRFAVHYVLGDVITITMEAGGVGGMEVTGQVAGEHLEPPACSAPSAAPAPSTPPAGATPGAAASPPPPPTGTPPPPGPEGGTARDRRSLEPPPRPPEPTSDLR